MFAPDYPIVAERILLRPVVDADAEALHAYQSRPDVVRYIPYPPRDLATVRERIAAPTNRSTLDEAGQVIWLAVERRDTGQVIGDVVFIYSSEEHRSAELGYVFNPEFHGHGYATEAARELLRLGFEGMGLHRMTARLDARNDASANVLRRLGMRQEAHLRENELFKGEWTDELQFALLAAEWPELS